MVCKKPLADNNTDYRHLWHTKWGTLAILISVSGRVSGSTVRLNFLKFLTDANWRMTKNINYYPSGGIWSLFIVTRKTAHFRQIYTHNIYLLCFFNWLKMFFDLFFFKISIKNQYRYNQMWHRKPLKIIIWAKKKLKHIRYFSLIHRTKLHNLILGISYRFYPVKRLTQWVGTTKQVEKPIVTQNLILRQLPMISDCVMVWINSGDRNDNFVSPKDNNHLATRQISEYLLIYR